MSTGPSPSVQIPRRSRRRSSSRAVITCSREDRSCSASATAWTVAAIGALTRIQDPRVAGIKPGLSRAQPDDQLRRRPHRLAQRAWRAGRRGGSPIRGDLGTLTTTAAHGKRITVASACKTAEVRAASGNRPPHRAERRPRPWLPAGSRRAP